MELQNRSTNIDYTIVQERTGARKFMANVFSLMFLALGVSALFAFLFSNNLNLLAYLIKADGTGLNPLGYIVMFAPLAFVLLMSFGYNRLPAPLMLGLFIAYAAINGISFGFILLIYTTGSVVACFLSAAAMFGVMAFMGYTTDKDLTSFGRIMTMGLIGIVIASLINLFMKSDSMGYVISFIGVLVFTGLTAYDVQKLKYIGEGIEHNGVAAVEVKKRSIMGALTLYLDFINLFLMLLRLFGSRRD
ncbi:Bax inhibitor-1/YccA family protein [Sediminibacterium soli]|uniref:Bax inhibitor-1/YccA family protein n=1 Tax=Sediminibacterium soli TaxID=2698829 RepID=UPI0013794B4A|nr:Bax inhibitor-1/YccA family protein [Sediminibacterium soli]NCI47551.1 Bax inhibitor-1/YccA family protein [Sediminibacterium soli]